MVQNIPHFRNTGRDYNGTIFKTTRNFTGCDLKIVMAMKITQ